MMVHEPLYFTADGLVTTRTTLVQKLLNKREKPSTAEQLVFAFHIQLYICDDESCKEN
jgi:hypothetical protein